MSKPRMMLALGAIAMAAAASASAAAAQAPAQATPKNWNYEIRNGQRVQKGTRVATPDGGWREEERQGNCLTVKEMSKAGEYKETRQCNPASPR